MPNRIIREGWVDSEAIDRLSPAAERFFLRLCLRADDYGRFHAHPQLLKSNLFPLKEDVTSADMTRCLAECEKAGLVRCYTTELKRYLVISKFGQRMRSGRSRFPSPDDHPVPAACPTDDRHLSDTCPASESSPPTNVSDPLPNVSDPPTPDSTCPPNSEAEAESESKVRYSESESDVHCPEAPAESLAQKAKEALRYLNQKAQRSYREVATNLKPIVCRLKEPGVDLVGIKQMIDRMVARWAHDPKMAEYLRPETLFGKQKFASYYDNRNLPATGACQPSPDARF